VGVVRCQLKHENRFHILQLTTDQVTGSSIQQTAGGALPTSSLSLPVLHQCNDEWVGGTLDHRLRTHALCVEFIFGICIVSMGFVFFCVGVFFLLMVEMNVK